MNNEFGDFQTPLALTNQIIALLSRQKKTWQRVLEPTCGIGNFISSVLLNPQLNVHEIQAIEIQTDHIKQAETLINQSTPSINLLHKNIFEIDLAADLQWQNTGPLLVLGNPPWITNAELGSLNSSNVPLKRNVKAVSGIEALTGSSNFDIAEAIIIKILQELGSCNPTIAMLCKTSVARNVFLFAHHAALPVYKAAMWKINAKKWFGASVDACLFYLDLQKGATTTHVSVFSCLTAATPETRLGISQGNIIGDIETYAKTKFLDGRSPLMWRQGLKHDAASVMELSYTGNGWTNKAGDSVDIESDHVYPLLKSTDLYHGRTQHQKRGVIVPQFSLGADTQHLQSTSPKLWNYLQEHRFVFERRKSSVYRNKPLFSIFGIGEYAFAPYKVAVSGLHKHPRFRLITPLQDKAVMLDDTCYFIACATIIQAALLTALLEHELTQSFLKAITFAFAKRPVTKKVLQRIDLLALYTRLDQAVLIDQAISVLHHADPTAHGTHSEWLAGIDGLFTTYVLQNAHVQTSFDV